jgi:hypothetical protein
MYNSVASITSEEQLDPAISSMESSAMPRIFRVTNFYHREQENHRILCTATLFHERVSIKVCWTVRYPDIRIKSGALVSPWRC